MCVHEGVCSVTKPVSPMSLTVKMSEPQTTTRSHKFLQWACKVKTLAFGGREQKGEWKRKEPKNLPGGFSERRFLSAKHRIRSMNKVGELVSNLKRGASKPPCN